jgi:hypothetical protein
MAAKIGTGDILFRVGSGSPSKVFLGSTAVQTVPGAPTFYGSFFIDGNTELEFVPGSNGGSPVLQNTVYINDAAVTPGDSSFNTGTGRWFLSFLAVDYRGAVAQMSQTNAVGEGPKSAPETVV